QGRLRRCEQAHHAPDQCVRGSSHIPTGAHSNGRPAISDDIANLPAVAGSSVARLPPPIRAATQSMTLPAHHAARGFGDGLRSKAEILEELFPSAARAVAVAHADEGERNGVLFSERFGDEPTEAAVDKVVLSCHYSARLSRGAEQCLAVDGTQ